MRRGVVKPLLAVAGLALAAPAPCRVRWTCCDHGARLCSFAAHGVGVLGFERAADSFEVEVDGFGRPDFEEMRQLGESPDARGCEVCMVERKPHSDHCHNLLYPRVTTEGPIESLSPFNTLVTLRWMKGARGEEYKCRSWWNGISWSRNPKEDQRLFLVSMTHSNDPMELSDGALFLLAWAVNECGSYPTRAKAG